MSLCGPSYMGLWNERTAAVENINHIMIQINTDLTATQIAVQKEILDGYWHRFQEAQKNLILKFSHITTVQESMATMEHSTKELYVGAKAALLQQQSRIASEHPERRIVRPTEIKMSTFSGKYTEWAAWRSEFVAKVLDARFDVSDKISILMGALTKEAATCAGRAERLDELELQRIWDKLERTYDNKYQQVYAHIAKIINVPPMIRPSADRMRSMIDVVDQHLRMLKRFEIDTDSWSPMVCVILLGKLDAETRNQWESKDALPSMPDMKALFNYLEQRILAIRNVEMSDKRAQSILTPSSQNIPHKPPASIMRTQKGRYRPYEYYRTPDVQKLVETHVQNPLVPPICKQCNNGSKHFLWQCVSFKQLHYKEMYKKLTQWNICEVCLISQHHAKDCTMGICPICKNGKHNSLVCPHKNGEKVNHLRQHAKPRTKQSAQ